MDKILTPDAIKIVEAEIDRQHIAHMMRVDLGNDKTANDYYCMSTKAKYKYDVRTHGRVYNAILVTWAVIWCIIFDWYDYFSQWNRA